MRLLNTETSDIEEFFGEDTPHDYAIVSHRWGKEEVSYQDWMARSLRPDVRSQDGFQKIEHCCKQAKEDGIRWVWIDTCCIDKTSSQELSEAINSMFQWYRESSVCYAYLRDYDSNTFDAASLEKSEWFFRGWTLQELVAPRKLIFYNKSWERFGSKTDQDVCEAVSEITKIDVEFLLGSDLESASIAKRMSWASKRKTTRVEDTAYCLMGLFDINMPLLYGEGPKAFKRLQEEIMKAYPEDHSLYAWGTPVDKCPVEMPASYKMIEENIDDQLASPEPLSGLLARSPEDFQYSRNYSPLHDARQFYTEIWTDLTPAKHPTIVGKGVRIELPALNNLNFFYQFIELSVLQARHGKYAVILCKDDTDEDMMLSIPLLFWGSGYTARVRELHRNHFFDRSRMTISSLLQGRITFTITPEIKPKLRAGDMIIRSILRSSNYLYGYQRVLFYTNYKNGVSKDWDNLIHFSRDLSLRGTSCYFYDQMDTLEYWSVVLGRIQAENRDFPAFQAGIMSICGPNIGFIQQEFICEKVFQSPSDKFTFDLDDRCEMEMRVNRRPLPNESGLIDIVDIVIRDKTDRTNSTESTGSISSTVSTGNTANTGRRNWTNKKSKVSRRNRRDTIRKINSIVKTSRRNQRNKGNRLTLANNTAGALAFRPLVPKAKAGSVDLGGGH